MSDKVLVPVELLQKIVDALRIANDWNLDELNIEPPEEWGLELPEDCNGVMEGWCYTTDFANHIESLIEAEPEPASAEPVAILCRQTDESKTEWFDHDPLIPGSTRHKIRANHGGCCRSTPASPRGGASQLQSTLSLLVNRRSSI